MNRRSVVLMAAAVLVCTRIPSASALQQDAPHGGPGAQTRPDAGARCAAAQPSLVSSLDAANTRLEAARQSNKPADMRAAIDDLQGALRDMRRMLEPCLALQTTADPHAGHTMSNMSTSPGAATAPRSQSSARDVAGQNASTASPIEGTVTMAAADHVMLKTTDGKDMTFMVTSETKVTDGTRAIRSADLPVGARIVVTPSNTDSGAAATVSTLAAPAP